MKRDTRIYNVIFPVWMIVWLPSWLWLFLIPANYLIDWLVFKLSLRKLGLDETIARKHNWKTCICGFVSDFIGAMLLAAALFGTESVITGDALADFQNNLVLNPWRSIPSLLVAFLGVALAGVCIYFLNKKIVLMNLVTKEQAHYIALRLAIFTAPYLYLLPMEWFWN